MAEYMCIFERRISEYPYNYRLRKIKVLTSATSFAFRLKENICPKLNNLREKCEKCGRYMTLIKLDIFIFTYTVLTNTSISKMLVDFGTLFSTDVIFECFSYLAVQICHPFCLHFSTSRIMS